MQVQKFVTTAIEALGGVVYPLEYALCQAVVPDELGPLFQGRTEFKLAFDFEVAEEQPDAEFITFGSYLFEQLLELVRERPLATVRFADVGEWSVHDPTGKIKRGIDSPAKLTLLEERRVLGFWAVFMFRIEYIADEKEEQYVPVWVDVSRQTVDPEMSALAGSIPYSTQPSGKVRNMLAPLQLASSLETAYAYAGQLADKGQRQRENLEVLQKERDRIHMYYLDLEQETYKRSQRKGLTEDKRQELFDKIASYKQEREKQLAEIEQHFRVKTKIWLDHGWLYGMPVQQYSLQSELRKEVRQLRWQYNPLKKQFVYLGD